MKTMRWCMLLLFGICVVFAACENPWVKWKTDMLFSEKPQPGGGYSPDPNAVKISDQTGLAAIAGNLSGNYVLTADINLSSYGNWTPIGDTWTTPFTGTLDGNGHTISFLTIPSATTQYQGLFGEISGTGTVKNLGLTNVTIISTDRGVGGVTAYNYGTIRNCYVTGNITGANSVGGIAGENSGGTIENCYTTASVTGTAATGWAGGITGNFLSNGVVKNCYATGVITGGTGSSSSSGGIVGFYQSGTVMNCVALNPSITGNSNSDRVSGETVVHTYGSNKARETMTVGGSALPSGTGTATNKHGTDVDVSSAAYSSVFDATWDTSTVWTFPVGSFSGPGTLLPRLQGFTYGGAANPPPYLP